ncbi:PREDICTED: HCLS1-associated protein X-1 [Lepidothrix coronata]|uniref:HCLS1-associated protein X-1 n=1 Tax=Lepidothrix coronata TaxID=321398 RepID=A0A6J0J6B7_9PASS|nr:PREDICTED: HCLS1-associated protein X-1 [Lepidothrix coronata]
MKPPLPPGPAGETRDQPRKAPHDTRRRFAAAALCGRPTPGPGAAGGPGSGMSFYDAFRGFFGFPGRRRPRDPLFGGAAWDEEEEDDGPCLAQPPQDFGFGFSPGASHGTFEELFRDMGELLGALGGAWAGPPQLFGGHGGGHGSAGLWGPLGAPRPDRPPPAPQRPPCPAPLEDARPAPPGLKEDQGVCWEWGPGVSALPRPPGRVPTHAATVSHLPSDLDSQVFSAGLGTILRPDEPKSGSYFQSVSVTKVTLPDGAVEERRTVQDSQGRRETTVTRRRGDQAFITTTKEDGQGKDYREEVLNMDDRELAQFAGSWPRRDELRPPNPSDPSSVLSGFLRHWFSSW